MSKYRTPGVYFKEIFNLPASVAQVETAIPAFIGHTDLAQKNAENVQGVPTRITSMLEFEGIFGKGNPESFTITIEDSYEAAKGLGEKISNRTITAIPPKHPSPFKLYYCLQLYFSNGGGPCYILSVGSFTNVPDKGNSTNPESILGGLEAIKAIDEPTLLVFPDIIPASPPQTIGSLYKDIYDAALTQCKILKDRFVIIDVKDVTADPVSDAHNFRDNCVGYSNLKYGAAYYPNLSTSLNYAYSPTHLTITHRNIYPSGFPLLEAGVSDSLTLAALQNSNPSLGRSVHNEIKQQYITLPPSGAIAGIYTRVDRERGVWKAPANVDVRNVIGPSLDLSHQQQETFNVDVTSGKSINVIRQFTGKGTLVWGARTLAGNDNEWRYIPVKRLFIFIEESLKKATKFVVFEPNDANTWLRAKTLIENFLIKLWRDGALVGAKPDQAFFVRVGLGQTMSAQDILDGNLIIEIGIAAVRPAEFTILNLTHKLQEH
ncbi:hypothetical protein LV84_01088 [Algoriphagus ratkowskyi]|uniref:Phage tail sheath family protein n=1 Tax=Algoriphagus ratkowskyi TaxID=57028 RepID=A0A2W7RZ23_9BACT|nr:phage tail sheath C-terminal domain-containing protein [Algoriphagus ratkowskyi]PZX59879.1 hypothetical protein LV84_01088 [Algoriphagus ratkowskyi]TXD78418.1 phage tail sheath family protein [Algoriphagus ratkowskyi]